MSVLSNESIHHGALANEVSLTPHTHLSVVADAMVLFLLALQVCLIVFFAMVCALETAGQIQQLCSDHERGRKQQLDKQQQQLQWELKQWRDILSSGINSSSSESSSSAFSGYSPTALSRLATF